MSIENKKVYSSGEVAKICGVTLRTVLNWIAKGWLNAHQLPGKRGDNRIAQADLLEFMNAHKMPLPHFLQPAVKLALVVDDEEPMAKSISRVLKGCGFKVSTAHDGFSAGVLYAQLKPDLMTLDLQMPHMNGFQVLEKVAQTHHGKILVISGMDESVLQKTLSLGADAALTKPFDTGQLESIIGSWFS